LLYELKIAGKELGAEWWQSIPRAMSVDNGRMVFTSTGNVPPTVILTRPLNPGLACDVEFEYQTPHANGFAVMLWSARKAPEKSQQCDGGWHVDFPLHNGRTLAFWHRGPKDGPENYVFSTHGPVVASTPYYAPIAGRKYHARVEATREGLRVFVDGG